MICWPTCICLTSDAQSVARGKKLVSDYGCVACHRINGVNPPESFAPDLSRIGSKPLFQVGFLRGMPETLPDYIAGKIHDPRAFGPALKMPNFSLTEGQIEALTTALLAQTDRAVTMPPELVRSSHMPKYHPGGDAGRLMEDLRCQSCHAINGNGGDMAPDLTFEGSAVNRTWLLDFMKNPNTLRPALIRRMPKFNLSDAEIKGLSDYMLSAYQASGFDSQALDLSSLNSDAATQGKATLLQQICLPVLPHRGLQAGQGLRGSSAGGSGRPVDSGLDVSLAEESQRPASWDADAELQPQRRRSPRLDRFLDDTQGA